MADVDLAAATHHLGLGDLEDPRLLTVGHHDDVPLAQVAVALLAGTAVVGLAGELLHEQLGGAVVASDRHPGAGRPLHQQHVGSRLGFGLGSGKQGRQRHGQRGGDIVIAAQIDGEVVGQRRTTAQGVGDVDPLLAEATLVAHHPQLLLQQIDGKPAVLLNPGDGLAGQIGFVVAKQHLNDDPDRQQ